MKKKFELFVNYPMFPPFETDRKFLGKVYDTFLWWYCISLTQQFYIRSHFEENKKKD